jgi:Tfp pilus assembly protein PilF
MLPVFCRYLWLMFWPAGLNIEHWPPLHHSLDVEVAGSALLLAGILVSGIILFRRDRRLGFWLLFFWVGLLPVSQIVPLFLLMYEHYLYMPIIGAAVLIGSGAAKLCDRVGMQRTVLLYSVLGIWLLALSVVSYNRTFVWRDSLTLFTDASAKSPNAFRVWEVLGGIHFRNGQIDDARKAYERSLNLKPDNTDVLWALGELQTNSGEIDKGRWYLQRVLSIKPSYVKAWASLGNNYRDRGDYSMAEEMYNKALVLQPEAIQVVLLLGELAIIQERYDEARELLNRVEANGGDAIESAYLMACVESLAGNVNESLSWLEKALGRGFHDYSRISADKNLSLLWKEPRYNYLLLKFFPDLDVVR